MIKGELKLVKKSIEDAYKYKDDKTTVEKVAVLQFSGTIKDAEVSLKWKFPALQLPDVLKNLKLSSTRTKVEVTISPSLQKTLDEFQ